MSHKLQGKPFIFYGTYIMCGAAVIILNLFLARMFFIERNHLVETAATQKLGVARMAITSIEGGISSVDKMLFSLNEMFQNVPDAYMYNNRDVLDMLQRFLKQTPLTRGLTFINPQGLTLYATHLPDPYRPYDLSDRSYFIEHRDHDDGRVHISSPIQSRADQRWIIILSRRLSDRVGGFRGVVTASVDVESILKMLEPSLDRSDDTLVLLNTNGEIIVRLPDLYKYVGTSLSGTAIFQESLEKREGQGVVMSPFDGRERVHGYSSSDEYPLIIAVTTLRDTVLSSWRSAITHYILLSFICSGSLIGLAIASNRWFQELAVAKEHAEAASRMKSDFLAHVSHELRTPLNAIIGFSDAILTRALDLRASEQGLEYIGYIRQSGEHLLHIINDILDMSKIEAGGLELHDEPVDLHKLCASCIALMHERAGEKGVFLDLATDNPALAVRADPLRLRQVLLNLLANAIKFTPRDGRVHLDIHRHVNGGAAISISDTGIGMNPEDILVAMKPFGQVSGLQPRPQQGTGLGLPLAKELVELHGGNLTVRSQSGAGTCVTIVLPPERVLADIC